jgi:hypothetical protein
VTLENLKEQRETTAPETLSTFSPREWGNINHYERHASIADLQHFKVKSRAILELKLSVSCLQSAPQPIQWAAEEAICLRAVNEFYAEIALAKFLVFDDYFAFSR